jgi:hypothetical protein
MILLEKEFDFFVHNQKKLVKKYKGKYIAIKNNKVLGAYNNLPDAVKETAKYEDLGTFLIQKCEPSMKVYTQTYHSRANFALK